MSKICLNAEGKGRVTRKKSRGSFSFESTYTLKAWTLGLYFPGKEKVIRLEKQKSGQYDVLKYGSFPIKYKAELQKLMSFLEKSKTGQLSCKIESRNKFYQGNCSEIPISGKLGDHFQVRLSEDPLVYLKASGPSESFFKKISLTIGNTSLYSDPEFHLELYVDQCVKLKLEK
ncbi:MAG: hypothetical protein ACO2ZP_09090 [Bacteriovoracaceae bacterium]